ncbi:hypothetical protein ES288_D06G047300v1 [Gossypium darwinii]|uniref:Uncharacterized protein n=2 Tax=Gossypium darwinii TaxID=34276 RepID=A0A5D2C4Y6_GOSDA|nr:hypothetical protein ES288_D06G047300v1 [Gossypium darwinii]
MVDLMVELMEDLLGIIQGACRSTAHARAALKYIVIGLSSHMDDILGKYKVIDYPFLTVYLYMCLFICGCRNRFFENKNFRLLT